MKHEASFPQYIESCYRTSGYSEADFVEVGMNCGLNKRHLYNNGGLKLN